MLALDEEFEKEKFIDGPNEIVEIDECKIGPQKYHRGRIVGGSWILGMIHADTHSIIVWKPVLKIKGMQILCYLY